MTIFFLRYFVFILILLHVSNASAQRTAVGILIDDLQKELDFELYKDVVIESEIASTIGHEPHLIDSQDIQITTSVSSVSSLSEEVDEYKKTSKKDWLFLVYMAGQNNLHKFVKLNLESMGKVGSTKNVHVVCQVDELGNNEVTRVHVLKNKIKILEEHPFTDEYISGNPESLYGFIAWAAKHFPSNKVCVILWGHGSGALDPHLWDRNFLPDRDDAEMFHLNEATGLLEVHYKINDLVYHDLGDASAQKGIAFNEEQNTYLTNNDLTDVFNQVQEYVLAGKKIDIVAFDACLMGMMEVAVQLESSVDYMVGSEEVVPGKGFPYNKLLEPFCDNSMSSLDFAEHMTTSYARTYNDIFADYTLSAIDLKKIPELKVLLNDCAYSLLRLIACEYGEEVMQMLFAIRASRKMTTPFYNRDYIDLLHTLSSLQEKVGRFKHLESISNEVAFLQTSIAQVQKKIEAVVLSSVHGSNQKNSSGLAIYWPRKTVMSSYQNLLFGRTTCWTKFLYQYVSACSD